MSNPVLSLRNIRKIFQQGSVSIEVLSDINLEIHPGQTMALIGPSGSGKTTLLQIAGLLDKPSSGEVAIDGHACASYNDEARATMRKTHIGMIYQSHHLLPDFSALENVMIPRMIAGKDKVTAREEAAKILTHLGLGERLQHLPSELSGGQQQRVAMARAMVGKPRLLLADEPTGNLDPKTAEEVFSILLDTTKAIGAGLLVVTHNLELAAKADACQYLDYGTLSLSHTQGDHS